MKLVSLREAEATVFRCSCFQMVRQCNEVACIPLMAAASRTLLQEWNQLQERMTIASIAFRNTAVQILNVLAELQNSGEI